MELLVTYWVSQAGRRSEPEQTTRLSMGGNITDSKPLMYLPDGLGNRVRRGFYCAFLHQADR